MRFHQIRNATVKLTYGGQTFLIDPYLAEKEAYPGFEGTCNSHKRHPTVPLKTPMEEILEHDAIIVTHTHADHWDEAAVRLIPKEKPLFVQHAYDAQLIRKQGFKDVRLLTENTYFAGVTLHRVDGQHGSDEAMGVIGDRLGQAMGVVFEAEGEKTLYFAGDTVWNSYVRMALDAYRPSVVVLNAGDARVPDYGSIIMGSDDVCSVCAYAPQALVIATHMEAVNHACLTRADLRKAAQAHGVSQRLRIPEDGEVCNL
ncbi:MULTISPECIES: MBL fold metallo-hydrolase [unclassified Saccharibacter]|uniref:MBL fold metallo-hydrolase n=1 Tax=unclassified Saccharibacter TaxID=2648722 RepID=UPI00132878D3|nr:MULTISPECIES: MBL fold metallo-hydrolase [unclassified Saccharibacter]MXV36913.1 MBL fold metallo-hydrolase [Saccharibacter sp. EH611]MXV58597.1 MBL fold metallo-hydrolase [Saccharibacter sp. EH70]MXV66103.1 MBL fold metallo-hydrolase [Saccharibacter sp. EH60]